MGISSDTDELLRLWLQLKLAGYFYGPTFTVLLLTVMAALAVRSTMGPVPAFLVLIVGLGLTGLVFLATRAVLGAL